MKNAIRLFTIIVIGVINCAQIATAHEIDGSIGRMSSKAGGIKKYIVDCSDDGNGLPDHLYLQLFDTKRPRNPALFSVQAFDPTGIPSEIINLPNESNAPSPAIEMAGGAGRYEIHVTKTRSRKKGVDSFSGSVHCETADGTHTGTTEPELIN